MRKEGNLWIVVSMTTTLSLHLLLILQLNYSGGRADAFVATPLQSLPTFSKIRLPFPSTISLSPTATASKLYARNAYRVRVSYEGQSCDVMVRTDETILEALERNGVGDQLCVELPFSCRRGNCMTCCSRHLPDSDVPSLLRGEDGLSPLVSEELKQSGFVLTCSSYVDGNGVQLELGENNNAWDAMFRARFEDNDATQLKEESSARQIRTYSEKNIYEWTKQIEGVYRASKDKEGLEEEKIE